MTRSPVGSTALRASMLVMALAGAIATVGCAGWMPERDLRPGMDEATVRQRMGEPTGRHAMPGGGTRLEYARGPAGFETWMVDLDAGGRMTAVDNVLSPRHWLQVGDGMPREELLRRLGRPAERQGNLGGKETWFWRYSASACLWLAVTLSAEGTVINGAAEMPDPRCEHNDFP